MPQSETRSGLDRQTDRKAGALPLFAVDPDPPPMLIHDPLRRGQTKPGHVLLGREEGKEYFIEILLLDADPGILHGHLHDVAAALARRDPPARGGYGHPPSRRHRL